MQRIIFTTLFILLFGCGQREDQYIGETTSVKLGFWGHLNNIENLASETLYLIYTSSKKDYRICIPQYMVDSYAGIQDEVEAAVAIWSHYIGREISLDIVIEELRPQQKGQSSTDQLAEGTLACGGADLVLGLSDIASTGHTELVMSYSPRKNSMGKFVVPRFQRSLVLNSKLNWASLEQITKVKRDKAAILEVFKARNQIVFSGKDRSLTLNTIVHEMGHVFGLCDQYPLAGNTTNCDPMHASKNKDGHLVLIDHSMMAKGDGLEELYLQDDDITGIRNLAKRFPGLGHKSEAEYMQIPVTPESDNFIKFAQVNSATHAGNEFIFDVAVFSRTKLKYSLEIWLEGDTRFQPTAQGQSNGAWSFVSYKMRLGLPDGMKVKKARLLLEAEKGQKFILE